VWFAIEIGVWFRDFEDESRDGPPAIADCHWSQRVGGEPPEEDERWWIIDNETAVDELIPLVTGAVEAALPVLDSHMDEARMIALFLEGKTAHFRVGRSYRDRIERLAAKTSSNTAPVRSKT
jgi:hypothetical protein